MAVQKNGTYSVYCFDGGVLKDIYVGQWRYSCALGFSYDSVTYNDLTYSMQDSEHRIRVPMNFKNGSEYLVVENLSNGNSTIEIPNLTLEGSVKEKFHEQFGSQPNPTINGIYTDDGTPCGYASFEEQCFYFFPNHYTFNSASDNTPSENGMVTRDRPCMLTVTNGESAYNDINFTLKNVGYTQSFGNSSLKSCNVMYNGIYINSIPSSSIPIRITIFPIMEHYYTRTWNDGYVERQGSASESAIVSVFLAEIGGASLGNASKDGSGWSISIPSSSYDRTFAISVTDEYGNSATSYISQEAYETADEYRSVYEPSGRVDVTSALAIGGSRVSTADIYFNMDVYINGSYSYTKRNYGYVTTSYEFGKNISTSSQTYSTTENVSFYGESFSVSVTYTQEAASVSYNYSIVGLSLGLSVNSNGDYYIRWDGGSFSASCSCSYVATWSDPENNIEYTYGSSQPSYSISIGTNSGSSMYIGKNPAGESGRYISVSASKGNASESVSIYQEAQTYTSTYGTSISYSINGSTDFNYLGGSFSVDITRCGYMVNRKYQDGTIVNGELITTSTSDVSLSAYDGASSSGFTVYIPENKYSYDMTYSVILNYSHGDVSGSERIVVTQSKR